MAKKARKAFTPVEKAALASSPFKALYEPLERIPVVVVENFPRLGRLAAMRFLEWAQQHPGGVISLPTGKTPEHFIKWVNRLLHTWEEGETKSLLEEGGVDPKVKPDMKSLRFVQIDEFYPIDPRQHNSFFHYVNNFYIEGFGLDLEKVLLMDLSKVGLKPEETLADLWPEGEVDLTLRKRDPQTGLEERQKRVLGHLDRWCGTYEEKIREWGGIGFFLGGIGPDGHIAFNCRGSTHTSLTRLTPTNFETQAAAAADLGGIDAARRRLVVTIGLGTITFNPECTAVILAAGEAKARNVSSAVQNRPSPFYPATALHALPNARFYVTRGAAKALEARRYHLLSRAKEPGEGEAERIIIDLALKKGKRLSELEPGDLEGDRFAELLTRKGEDIRTLAENARQCLVSKITRGVEQRADTRFLHTEPHHDDIMLGYLPALSKALEEPSNTHAFVTMTSGFTAVTNEYMRKRLDALLPHLESKDFQALADEGCFLPERKEERNRDVRYYLEGIASRDKRLKTLGESRRLLSNIYDTFGVQDLKGAAMEIEKLHQYLESAYPGKKDPGTVQILKGACREWEAECLWGYFGCSVEMVGHLRLGFYTGDIFTEEPTLERDVPPILRVLERADPDVLSVALDPEASGPDTHYKVLQATRAALERYLDNRPGKTMRIWGYRNVWYRYHPSEANLFVPVTLPVFDLMEQAFLNTFITQKDAAFPSYEHDGPFCELAQRIQVEQFQAVRTLLGEAWFNGHSNPLIRAARGLVFLREMSVEEFYKESRDLKRAAEGL